LSDSDWSVFADAVHTRFAIDLGNYHPAHIQRRVGGLMARARVQRLPDYLASLDGDPERLTRFRDALTINVSEFFRSPDRFEELGQVVLPRLLAERPALRVWSAGCSYGPEPYSVALLLAELAPGAKHDVLATDVDEPMLERAQAATFTERDLRNVPPALRYRHFVPGRRAPRPAVRDLVRFQVHDLLAGAPECDFDLVLCRNVLMYFTGPAKTRAAAVLYDAIRPGGYLFTASGEALAELPEAGFKRVAVGFYRKEEMHARS
jgi:chemotaxis protein methyltransferase CheR